MKMTLIPVALLTVLWLSGCRGTAKTDQVMANTGIEAKTVSTEPDNAAGSTIAGEPIHLTKSEFLSKVYDFEKNPNNWIYSGDKPCIIDFYADWCRPCKMVAPIMAELAEKYKGQITVYKINTDEEKELSQFFGIRSIPTVLFCPMNGKPQMTQGALPKEEFEKAVNEVLLVKKVQP